MTDYQPMSTPPPDRPAAHPRGEAPSSVHTSVNLVWAIVAVSVINAVLSFVMLDDLAASMAEQGGAADADTARAIVIGSTLFGLVVFGALWVVLGIFLRKGANWARIVLTVLAAIGLVFGLFGLGTASQPALFMVTGVITLVLEAALLWYLWQKDSSAYLKPRPAY